MHPEYWRGFRDGQEHERKKAAQVLAFYIESLRDVKGIGDALYQRIVEHINTIDVRERKSDESSKAV
ncbi:hypothetical protein IC805_05090 [Geobacillus thermoleovorans]|uniref:hypothetical protein n=1 Tax=Geobacillus thermoleovorans TaxID=33941 RepID=UPI0009BD4327|nr:hypothetical protein [Geobacillus thermoleovorans]OQP13167.1 hypothetical protein B1692_08925 [Geobacillus thermoleovorans]QNU22319.1 hypothetical protein IC805_05090 [Geobacillus thermoleovorans]